MFASKYFLLLALFFHGWSLADIGINGRVEVRKVLAVQVSGPGSSGTLVIPPVPRSATYTFSPSPRFVADPREPRPTGSMTKTVAITCSGQADSVIIELRAVVEDKGVGSRVVDLVKSARLGQETTFDEFEEFGLGPVTAEVVELEPPDREPVTIRGIVTDRPAESRYEGLVAGAEISFEEDLGRVRGTVVSGAAGEYAIHLPPARYFATVLHPGHRPYSTRPGFVVASSGDQTVNFFLSTTEPDCPTTGRYPGQSASRASDADRPPAVWIQASETQVRVGTSLVISVWATDDRGLASIWWWGEETGDPQLDVAHSQDCSGEPFSYAEWTISPSKPGKLVFAANARDTAYGKRLGEPHQASEGPGIACVAVVVVP